MDKEKIEYAKHVQACVKEFLMCAIIFYVGRYRKCEIKRVCIRIRRQRLRFNFGMLLIYVCS